MATTRFSQCLAPACAALVALGAILLAAAAALTPPQTRFAVLRPQLARALTPAGVVELDAADGFPLYELDARLEPGGTLTGHVRLTLINRSGQALSELAFHLFANGANFHSAAIVVSAARVAGLPVAVDHLTADRLGLFLPLPQPLPAGARTEVTLDYHLTVSAQGGFHGLLSHQEGVWCLYSWYPEPAVFRHGAWELHPVSDKGDVTQNESLHLLAHVTLPAGMQAISGGSTIASRTVAGGTCVTIASPFTRNLALVVGSDYLLKTRAVGATTVRSWWRGDDAAGAARALDVASAALGLFGARFGPYSYTELDVVEVPLGENVGGMESTGLVLMDRRPYEAVRTDPDAGAESLPMLMLITATAHEVGHQWWYNLVGNDSYSAPWLDESLTNWSAGYCLEQTQGAMAAQGAATMCAMECAMEGREHLALDLDVNRYDDTHYGAVVYGRGALFYQALRRKVGEARFFAFLRGYLAKHRFGYVERADWETSLRTEVGAAVADDLERVWLRGEGLDTRTVMTAAIPMAADVKP